jgi:hypothetical protein
MLCRRDTGRIEMKLQALMLTAAAALAFAAPAQAQDTALTAGNYWDVAAIDVEDGQDEAYADYVAGQWRRSEEFARQQGWIQGYHVLSNPYARENEPDLYLVTVYNRMPTPAEEQTRQRAFERFMERTSRQLSTESGERVRMRRLAGSMLLREMNFRAAR